MTEKLEFKDWWDDFTYQFRNDKDGGYEKLRRLISEVRTFTVDKRKAFIDELIQFDNLRFYACALIKEFGTEEQVGLIKEKANELINTNSNDSILNEYINVIISRFQSIDKQILTKYFIDFQKQRSDYLRVPGELYDTDKDLFLNAFRINIERYPIDQLCDYDGFLYLTQHLNALEFLVLNLPFSLSEKLKIFALAKVNHSVSDFDNKLKSRLIEISDLKKSEIESIKQNRLNSYKKRQQPTHGIANKGFSGLRGIFSSFNFSNGG